MTNTLEGGCRMKLHLDLTAMVCDMRVGQVTRRPSSE